jgi:hypothetical protein
VTQVKLVSLQEGKLIDNREVFTYTINFGKDKSFTEAILIFKISIARLICIWRG